IEEKEMYFSTPFFIWANYDIPEMDGIQTSNNYLGTMMLEQTGLEMAPYNYFLKNQQEQIPALNHLGYMDADGTFHTWQEGEEEELVQEWNYECLQYNNLAEKRRRLDDFFTVASGNE
ncbi:MAG: LTA synthase family protein, partial [Eubacterium sp.]|nr:LTA synthase family protein [Eubacterium sp.]